jgi:hypothetical protein
MIMSKEWMEEVESSSSIIQIYRNFKILLCTIRDAASEEVLYDPKVRVNVMSKTMADHVALEEPLTFSCKHVKWIDSQIVKSRGILHVISLKMGHNKAFLDFHIFDISEGEECQTRAHGTMHMAYILQDKGWDMAHALHQL